MHKRLLMLIAMLVAGVAAMPLRAGEERAIVTPEKGDQFGIDRQKMSKNLLLAYLADLQDSKHITGIVLKHARDATPMQKHLLKEMGDHLKIETLSDESGELKPLVDPTL